MRETDADAARALECNIYMILDLETKGFTIIENFLSDHEIKFLINDYYTRTNNNKNYNAPLSSQSAGEKISYKINNVLQLINQQTILRPNFLLPTGMFVNTQYINFKWHQDHESFYIWQHHYDSINFYMPLIKPDKNQTGLSIVPMDRLAAEIPDSINHIVGQGAKSFPTSNTMTRVLDEVTGSETCWNFDINDLAIHPTLSAGDLLLLRGDVIHKTQDLNTKRLAISFRSFNSDATISKAKLVCPGSYKKQRFIENNPEPYKILLSMFDELNTDSITAQQLFLKFKTIIK
jgi:hypothetical protein